MQVVKDIGDGSFGNDFKNSSLEFVLNVITEQKQVFEGAAHPFCWTPKLRIPDIYENEVNKRAFGTFLENCLNAKSDDQILKEIVRLESMKIKGLGPAVASILYFLHPTLMPPFNTAIVNGFNSLFNAKKKLGSWMQYLQMRDGALAQVLERQAEAVLATIPVPAPHVNPWMASVRRRVAELLSDGTPTAALVARPFRMSVRTLHRRLADGGLTFHALLDDDRRELAEGWMRDEQRSLSEIAFMLGFSELCSFTRAYKRWTGAAPSRSRLGR